MTASAGLKAAILGLLCGCLVAVQGCRDDAAARGAVAMEAAPDFDLALFDGGRFRLKEQRGRAVVVNFFASWCLSCGEEAPTLGKVARLYAQRPVVFVAVAVEDTEKKAKAFLQKAGLDIPAGLDRSGAVKDAYGVYGMPMTFFIDKAGKVSYVHAGTVTELLLRHEIDKVL